MKKLFFYTLLLLSITLTAQGRLSAPLSTEAATDSTEIVIKQDSRSYVVRLDSIRSALNIGNSLSVPANRIPYGNDTGDGVETSQYFTYSEALNNIYLADGFFGTILDNTYLKITESSGNFTELGHLNNKPTLKLYEGGYGALITAYNFTADRDIEFQDKDGTVALLSDISSASNLQQVLAQGTTYIVGDKTLTLNEDSLEFLDTNADKGVKISVDRLIFTNGSGVQGFNSALSSRYLTVTNGSRYGHLRASNITSNMALEMPNNSGVIPISFTDGTTQVVSNDDGEVDLSTLNLGGGSSDSDITVVQNIAELRALTVVPADGHLFIVKEHTSGGVGGGTFEWQNTNTDTDDNGVTIKATTIATGRAVRKVKNAKLSIEDFGGIADDDTYTTTDDSQAFLNLHSYLRGIGSGEFIIPRRANNFYVTISEALLVLDWSYISMTGGGSIFVDSVNPNQSVTVGRGTLIKAADGTKHLYMGDITINVDEGCVANNIINGTICADAGADWKHITLNNVDIIQEDRALNQGGSHAITFSRDTADATDTASGEDLTIVNSKLYLTGHSNYGILLKATVSKGLINKNDIIFTNTDADTQEAYNGISVYGDSEFITVSNNYLYGEDVHSLVAVSGGRNCLVIGNVVEGITRENEAAFEFEYKQGHATYLTDPDFQPEGVSFVGNTSKNCTIGYMVARREIFSTNNTTDLAPRDVIFDGNFAYNSTQHDVIVVNNSTSTPDYTYRIENVKFKNNFFKSEGITQVHLYDMDGIDFINNDVIGGGAGSRNLHIGRTATISPIGHIRIKDNDFIGATNTACVFIESLGDDVFVDFSGNLIDGKVNGVRGLQAIANISLGTIFDIKNNTVKKCTDGLRVDGQAANIAGSSMSGNYVFDSTSRPFDFAANDGTAVNNTAINGSTTSTFTGTGIITSNNKEL